MATFRVERTPSQFATINKTFIYDSELSFKAKGIMTYLLSRPDDWEIYTTEIEKHAQDKKDSVASGIKELIEKGYIERKQKRSGGKFGGYDYSVYEKPKGRIVTAEEKPQRFNRNGKSENGKSDTTNNNSTKNDLTNNKDTVSESLKHISNELEIIQSPLKIQEIEELIKDLGNEALDIVKVATDYTRDNNKGINYLIKVLTNWIKEDVDTKEKAENKVKPKKQSSNIDGMLDDLLGSDS